MKLTTAQFQAVTRYRYLGGPRPAGVPHITVVNLGLVEYHRVTGWWAQFDAWQGWIDGRKQGPRPHVWRIVPPFAWQLRSAILKARKPINMHPAPKPTPLPTVPPLPPRATIYVNGIYTAQNPLAALAAKPKYTIWFTADPSYDPWATRGAADSARDAGHPVGVWFVPTQVSMARAQEVASRLGTDHIMGQAETLDEFRASWNCGCRAVIGNMTACFEDQEAAGRIRSGEMIFVNEFYWNQDRSRKPDNHNLPVPSMCIACYDGHSDSTADAWEPHYNDYHAAGYTWPTMSAYGPGMTAADYDALP